MTQYLHPPHHHAWLLPLLAGMLMVASLARAVEVGDPAPDFTLPSTTGEAMSLSQFRGKKRVFIEFYTNDFVPTCTANLAARKDDYSAFQALNVEVLAIGANSKFSQKVHADSLQLPYPLLSDYPDMKTIRAYGVGHPGRPATTVAQRAFFLIDEQGIVRGKWPGEDLVVAPNEIFLKAVQELAAGH